MNRRRNVVILAGLLVIVAALMVGWRLLQPRDHAWARLQQGGALRVAVDPSFPPFDDVDNEGRLVGFDIDLARELGERMGVPVEFKVIAFDGLVDAVLAGQADVVISAFPLDPRLAKDVRYSWPYFEGGLVLVVPEGSDVVGSDDLAGRKVAVEWGSLGDAWARANDLEIVRQGTAYDALSAVSEGDSSIDDAVIVNAAIVDAVTYAESTIPGLALRTPPLEPDPYVIVLPLHASKLSLAVNQTLAEIMADGTWNELTASHFERLPPMPEPMEHDS